METVCGVDGCGGGWFAVSKNLATGRVTWSVHPETESLFAKHGTAQVIAIDIPIGLPESGPRLCDLKARQLLGAERGSAVFAAPTRSALTDGNAKQGAQPPAQPKGNKLSGHALRALGRVSQVDAILRRVPGLRKRVREIHPEVSFFFLGGGRPMRHSKETPVGRAERTRLLAAAYGQNVSDALLSMFYMQTTADDVLDAFAALWTAERIHNETHLTIPPAPPVDRAGLPMEIVA